jgi:hypothetical protein
MVHDDVADFRARTGHEVDHARRQSRFFEYLEKLERDRRRI